MDEPTFLIGDRLRALRALAGYGTPKEMHDALARVGTHRGLSQTNLYAIERDQKPVDFRNLREIADLCGVPIEWFTADFSRLAEISPEPRQEIARLHAETAERIAQRRAEARPELTQGELERLRRRGVQAAAESAQAPRRTGQAKDGRDDDGLRQVGDV